MGIHSIQKNAQHPETFSPCHISLPLEMYLSMVRKMHLPLRGVETSSLVGPFYACDFDQNYDDSHLRKSAHRSEVLAIWLTCSPQK